MNLREHSSPRGQFLNSFRAVTALHFIAVFVQAVYAGEFLSGEVKPVRLHEVSAWIILTISALQLTFAIFWHLRVSRNFALVFIALGTLLCEALQTGTGYGRFLEVHIPLGVLIFGALGWQLIKVFGSSLERGQQ